MATLFAFLLAFGGLALASGVTTGYAASDQTISDVLDVSGDTADTKARDGPSAVEFSSKLITNLPGINAAAGNDPLTNSATTGLVGSGHSLSAYVNGLSVTTDIFDKEVVSAAIGKDVVPAQTWFGAQAERNAQLSLTKTSAFSRSDLDLGDSTLPDNSTTVDPPTYPLVSEGRAGLESSGAPWLLFATGAATAFALAGLATLKFAHR
jgi:hypothetical protein